MECSRKGLEFVDNGEPLLAAFMDRSGVFIKAGSFEGCRGRGGGNQIQSNTLSRSFLFIERSLQRICGRADRV